MHNKLLRFLLGLLVVLSAGCSTAPTSTVTQAALVTATDRPSAASEATYVVRAGDTLAAIGRRFGISSKQLQHLNGIADPRTLKVGARLFVPRQGQPLPGNAKRWSRFIWPLKQLDVTSEFGTRNGRHKGIDLRAPKGTSVYAAADGVVHFSGRQRGYGKVIILKHEGNIQTFYAHNNKNMVSKGQQIRQGELIARVGRTGNASGNHLHFEYVQGRQRLNPRDYVGK